MKILVCFKTTPVWERVLENDWEHFSEHADLSYAGKQINCFDESALELALRLKDAIRKQGREATCVAVTVGALPPAFAQTLFAAGFDDVVSLGTDSMEFAPAPVVAALTEYAAQGGFDLILTGKTAGMADTGLVPLLLAQRLKLPLLQDVLDAQLCEGGVAVRCQEPDGVWERCVRTPVLVSMGNSPAVLRAVTLRARLSVKSREARVIPVDIPAEPVERQFSRPVSKRSCIFLPGDELIGKLLKNLEWPPQTRVQVAKGDQGSDLPNCDSLPPSVAARLTPPSSKEGLCCPPKTIVYEMSNIPWRGASEALAHLVADWRVRKPDFALLPDTSLGRQLAAGLAATVNSFLLTDASLGEDDTVTRRVCASNLILTQRPCLPAVLTIAQLPPNVERIPLTAEVSSPAWLIGEEQISPAANNGLANPQLVVICGAGMGNRENCDKVRQLADKLGAGFGLTRMAALSGWGNPDEIVGQSGAIVSPEICLVLGASGAGAFVVGIENAGRVIAVNTDKNALIFRNADIGIVTDAPALVDKLLERMDSL